MIPDGWHYAKIGDLVEGLDAGVSVNSEDRPIEEEEIGVLKVSAVTYGKFDPTAHKAIMPSEIDRVTVFPQKDSIIISRANTLELVGASAYIDKDYPNLFLSDKLWQIRISEHEYSIRWLSFVLSSDEMRSRISDLATGTSSSMKNISQSAFLSLETLVPPLPEQLKIAAILSTWDEAIALTERLIATLRQRKQALMQLLLSGEVRFKEFEDQEWRELTLKDVSHSMESGGTPSTQVAEYWEGNTPWITGADFDENNVSQVRRFITDKGLEESSTKVVKSGDILLVTRTGVGKMAIAPFDVAISQDITGLVPKRDLIQADYLLYYLGSLDNSGVAPRPKRRDRIGI